MPISLVLESIENLDDSLKSLYVEKGDKYVLDTDSTIRDHPDVLSLRNAYDRRGEELEKAKSERDALKDKVSNLPEDFDPEKWAKLKDGKADEAALIKLRQELEADRDKWKAEAETAKSNIVKFAIERDLSDALITAGITDPGLTKGARAMLSGMVKTNDDGRAIVDTDMGPIGVSDYVAKWAATEGKAYVTPASGGGRGGNNGTGGGNKNPLIDKVPALADLPEK